MFSVMLCCFIVLFFLALSNFRCIYVYNQWGFFVCCLVSEKKKKKKKCVDEKMNLKVG